MSAAVVISALMVNTKPLSTCGLQYGEKAFIECADLA